MRIIEYKMQKADNDNPYHFHVPDYVKNGGYWLNPDDDTLIDTVPDNADYDVPDSVVTLTPLELVTRQLAIHQKHPMKNYPISPDEDMTEDAITAAVTAWINYRNSL